MDKDIALFFKLHDYQIQMVNFVESVPKCGLFLQMGLGKTRIALASIADLMPNGHILVIAPNVIARTSWIDEIKRIKYPFRYKSFLVDEKGRKLTKAKRLEAYEECKKNIIPTIYFINRELVKDLVDNFKDKWIFPFVVIDEFQSFKSFKSGRFKAIKTVINQTERIVGLTGTPAPNGLMDLWAQIYLLDNGKRLGKNISAYRNIFFDPGRHLPNGTVVEWIPKNNVPCIRVDNYGNIMYCPYPDTSYPLIATDQYGNEIMSNLNAEEYIYRMISDIVISMDNCNIQLPDVTYSTLYAYMSDEEYKTYLDFKKTQVLNAVDDDGNEIVDENGDKVTAQSAAVLTAKLAQMASGNIYIDDKHHYANIHNRKIEILQYIADTEQDNLLVAYYFQSDKDVLLQNFSDAIAFDGTPEMVHDWNAGKIKMLLIQPASAGFGLNLQEGSHTLVWYTLTWNLEQYLQTNARLHRQGQKYPVNIIHILTKNTIDYQILKALQSKDTSEKKLLDAVKFTLDDTYTDEEEYDDI